jgi:hypothetical protein
VSLDTPASHLRDAVAHALVAEFATHDRERPVTTPVTPFYDSEREVVVVSAAPAFAGKARRAAENPRVGLLLDGPGGTMALTGTATVRDADLEANAERLAHLIDAAPPSQKRAVMRDAVAFMSSPLGLLLLDWYGLRILIEIEPTAVHHRDPRPSCRVTPWPAADLDANAARSYEHAVATVVDADGWPRTWSLGSVAPSAAGLSLSPPADVTVDSGQPACVLCHHYSDDLESLGQHLVRGRVVDDGTRFVPASATQSRNETTRDFLRFVRDGKRATRAYFRDRDESYRWLPNRGRFLRAVRDAIS